MVNREHLNILNRGVHSWNQWRKKHTEILPDLSKASLEQKDFTGANFRNVNFAGAKLADTILCNADLSCADFSEADLNGINLKRAILGETTFKRTKLEGAKFHHARIRATEFIDVDLSVAKGLEQADHLGPSTLDFGTIYHSRGKFPEEFLYGAGIPDIFIEYIRSQGKAPFDYYSCFISYASEDVQFVEQLCDDLEEEGIRCWFAPIALKPGDRFPQYIEDAIRQYDKLIVVLSQNSIQSTWVEHEVNLAREKERKRPLVILPISLDNAAYIYPSASWVTDIIRRHRHIGDFRGWEISHNYQTALEKLLEALIKDEV